MAESKVVIKINYDRDKHTKTVADTKMVTVWHFRRILAALSILVILIFLLIYWLSSKNVQNTGGPEQTLPAESVQRPDEDQTSLRNSEPDNSQKSLIPARKDLKPDATHAGLAESNVKPTPAIIFDKKVIRHL